MKRLHALTSSFALLILSIALFDTPAEEKNRFQQTPQAPDILLFKGDTLAINATPLEAYFDQVGERNAKFFPSCMSSACGRGYQALWQIEGGSLYLHSIHDCCNFTTQLPASKMISLLGDRFDGDRAFAEWYTGILPSPQGKRLLYRHSGWGGIYEYDVIFHIKKGVLVKRDTTSNVPTRDPQFPGGLDSLQAFVYQSIDWNAIPHLYTTVTVLSSISIDTVGQVEMESADRARHPDIEAEIRRAMEQLPRWQIGYYGGEKISMQYTFPIPLSESIRRRYSQ